MGHGVYEKKVAIKDQTILIAKQQPHQRDGLLVIEGSSLSNLD